MSAEREHALWEAMERIMAETRWPQDFRGSSTRVLAVTMTWAKLTIPSHERTWKRIIALAGWPTGDRGWWRLREAIGQDAPRFEAPESSDRECEAPMIRRHGPCGQRASSQARVTDPATGRWRMGAWCNRHRALWEDACAKERARQAKGGIPEPAPNTGGMLYLHVPSDIWVAMYGWARYGNWEIPALGLHPDRWPVIEPEHAFTPPSLTVVAGDGDGGVGLPRPSLQVVGGA